MLRWPLLLAGGLFFGGWAAFGITLLPTHEVSYQTMDRFLFPHHFAAVYREPPPSPALMAWYNRSTVRALVPAFNADVSFLRAKVAPLMQGCSDWRIYIAWADSTNSKTLQDLNVWRQEQPDHVTLVPVNRTWLLKRAAHTPAPRVNRHAFVRNLLKWALRAAEPRLPPNAVVLVYDCDHWGPMSKRGMLESMKVLSEHPTSLYAISALGTKSLIPGIVYLRYDWYAYDPAPPSVNVPATIPRHIRSAQSSFSGSAVYLWRQYRRTSFTTSPSTPLPPGRQAGWQEAGGLRWARLGARDRGVSLPVPQRLRPPPFPNPEWAAGDGVGGVRAPPTAPRTAQPDVRHHGPEPPLASFCRW
jgi:hypothetical protein